MSRDWANEPWRKLYVRESPADFALLWQARTLRPMLLMYCDRMGLLEVEPGPRRIRLVAGLLRLPDDYVKAGIDDLLDDGSLVELENGYFFPKFEEAQRARKTVAQRVREHRERKAAVLRNVSSGNETFHFDTDKKRRDRNLDSGPLVLAAVPAAPQAHQPARAVVVKNKRDTQNNLPTTTPLATAVGDGTKSVPERASRFMEIWNSERKERENWRRAAEEPAPEQLPALALLLDAVEQGAKKLHVREEDAFGCLVSGFLGDGSVNHRTLKTLLNPNVWGTRLDAALAMLSAERAKPRRL